MDRIGWGHKVLITRGLFAGSWGTVERVDDAAHGKIYTVGGGTVGPTRVFNADQVKRKEDTVDTAK